MRKHQTSKGFTVKYENMISLFNDFIVFRQHHEKNGLLLWKRWVNEANLELEDVLDLNKIEK